MRVTGSELIGLVPKKVLIDAGKYFLRRQKRSLAISEREIIHIACKSLGLNELSEFKPEERIIEYMIDNNDKNLSEKSIKKFAELTSSESPAPGGGSISAYCGALGVSLGIMVANLSAHKRGWDDEWEFYSNWGEKGVTLQEMLIDLVDEDTNAFNSIIKAFSLPKDTDENLKIRDIEIQKATKNAIDVPYKIMHVCIESCELLLAMAKKGNPNSISDVGVGMYCIHAAVKGSYLNVRINSKELKDKKIVKKVDIECNKIIKKINSKLIEIQNIVDKKL